MQYRMPRTPWELFEASIEEVDRVLLYGSPGTGKTTAACSKGQRTGYYNVTLHEEATLADLFGMWMPSGDRFEWYDGVGIRAWREGRLLVVNEVDHASGSVLTIFNALLDDKFIANITVPLGSGRYETISPHKDFKVIGTMNGDPEDLPDPLQDRFDIKIKITEPHPNAIAALPKDLRDLCLAAYSGKIPTGVTYRMVAAYGKLRDSLGDDAFYVFGHLANDVKATLTLGRR